MSQEREEILSNLISQQTTVGRVPFEGRGFYSASSTNRYAIYSVGIDRFILVDGFDLWITLTCAKLLSSKLPTVVFALSDSVPEITQEDCLFWTITNKNIYVGGNQTPALARLDQATSVERVGAPIDYITDEQIQMLVELQNYALFVQRALYAIKFADALTNPDDHFFFAQLIEGNISDILEVRGDHSRIPNGYVLEVNRILYTAQSIDEAINQINERWLQVIRRDGEFRTRFYNMLGIPEPEVTRAELPTI